MQSIIAPLHLIKFVVCLTTCLYFNLILLVVEVYAPFIPNVPVSSPLENVLSAPTEYEAGWIPGPF